MKKLLAITLLTLTTVSFAQCELTLTKKKATAKTAYINGVSISKKIQTAISASCDIKFKTLNKAELREMDIARLTVKLEKLRASATK